MRKSTLRVTAPIFLLQTSAPCWRCHTKQLVVALAFRWVPDPDELQDEQPRKGEPLVLDNIHAMPRIVLDHVLAVNPRFEKRTSKTTETAYYMNLCECGANFGDWYLFNEPGGAFFPTDERSAAQIAIHELPLTGTFDFDCSYGMGLGGLILKQGRYGPVTNP